MEQINIFDMLFEEYSIPNKIRLVETFSGYGSQAMALRNIGAEFEHYRAIEIDEYAMKSYNAIHGTDFTPTDICAVKGEDLGIVDKDKYTYLLTYSFPCFVGETLILTNNGYTRIDEVKENDKVLTKDNTWEKVEKLYKNGKHETLKVITSNTPETICTSNHKFYVGKIERKVKTKSVNNKTVYIGQDIKVIEEEWKEAKELKRGDLILFPVTKVEKTYYTDNEDFWYVIGRYLADGCKRQVERCFNGKVTISCDDKKLETLLMHISNTELNYKVRKGTTCMELDIYGKEINEFLRTNIGNGSWEKFISTNILHLPKKQLESFLCGYISGDGCETNAGIYFTTVNEKIVLGIQQIVAKLYGIIPCVSKIRTKEKMLRGNKVKASYHYSCFYNINAKGHKSFVEADDRLWVKVKSIEENGEAEVYDLQVKNSHTYTANNLAVHNCTDISVAGKQMGMAEGSNTRSSLLWQIKRILQECKELDQLPDILLLENVPAIHNQDNVEHLRKWIDFLESLGYSNYGNDLNASDYGVAQNRQRYFLVSLLGKYNYKFPTPMELTRCLEDYFEDLTEEQALQYIVKSPKAHNLLVELDEKGELD